MKSMSNVDIYRIVKELNEEIIGTRIDKSYQPTYDTIRIKLRKAGEGRKDLVMQAGVRIHLTDYPQPNPTIPPNFPMLLRKHLSGGTITSIKQHNFDRIIEITVQKNVEYTLIVELFSKGNVILLDEHRNIISPLKHRKWQDRKVTSHEEYKYPPEKGININDTNPDEIKDVLKSSDADVTRTIAMNGLGGLYAEEIISYTNIQKTKLAKDLTDEEIVELDNAIKELFNRIENEPNPQIIIEKEDNSKNKDLVPINLNKYKEYESKPFDNFNIAADEFYSKKIVNDIKSQEEDAWSKRIGKFEKRLNMQEESLEGFYKTIDETQHKGDTIYAHYNEIQGILDVIANARLKYSWKEIGSIIKKSKKEGNIPELSMIESVDKMGVLSLKLDDVVVQIDSNIGIPESAEKYYNKGKKAKRKINGVKEAIENTKKEIAKLESKKEIAIEELKEKQKPKEKRELKWYEKIRWFISRDGYLVIGGRDANSNEQVVKKYSKNNDIYLHCDIHGAPSTIVQNNSDDEIPESTLYDAACFASSYSSAWSEGFSSYDSYWVTLDQVSKTPQSGEFLKKGSFVIRGRKNFIRNVPVLIAIGIVEYDDDKRIMAGPVQCLDKMTDNYVIVKPGFTKKERISKEILNIIDKNKLFGVDDIVRNLPSGKCDLLDIREYNQKYGKIR
ncbi:ribosome rescue protein RqcH [Methanosphaera sp.]|uniref:ribosome rescue protein RqcH n=1 Tax=Methanosphaera sp. TaxID=2666342 RepID=UPI002E7AA563|nr:ribosome rescue protein RqcH [Methanosphaera sp.]MEE1117643.1 ribosome rescue protein RqcH [Methanosphaera sp.]